MLYHHVWESAFCQSLDFQLGLCQIPGKSEMMFFNIKIKEMLYDGQCNITHNRLKIERKHTWCSIPVKVDTLYYKYALILCLIWIYVLVFKGLLVIILLNAACFYSNASKLSEDIFT